MRISEAPTRFEVVMVQNGYLVRERSCSNMIGREWVFTTAAQLAMWIRDSFPSRGEGNI